MDWKLIFFSGYEIVLTLVYGVLTVFVAMKLLNRFLWNANNENLLKKGNIAIALLSGTIIVNIFILVQGSIRPSTDTLRAMVLAYNDVTFLIVVIALAYSLFFFLISTILGVVVISLIAKVYDWSTKNLDEIQEIRANNIAVAIMVSFVIFGITFYMRQPFNNFMQSLVDYESMEKVTIQKLPVKPLEMDKGKKVIDQGKIVLPE